MYDLKKPHYEAFDFEKATYIWDDCKDTLNYKKHGVFFKTAVKAFKDPEKLIRFDQEHSKEEKRYNILGKAGKVLFIVFVFRNYNTIRLISARIATRAERDRYNYGEDEL